MRIDFDSKAENTRWLRLSCAVIGRSGVFWTELRDGALASGSATPEARIELSMACEGARAGNRRWHRKAQHPSTRPSMRFDSQGGEPSPPSDYPAPALARPFGEAPTAIPTPIARHALVQRVQRNMPGVVPEVRYAPGRFTLLWNTQEVRVRLQLTSDVRAETCAAPAAASSTPPLREATDRLGGLVGGQGFVVATGRACAQGQRVHYRLVEAARLIPSHDALTFRVHPDYPTGVQERRYHADPAEQAKVIDNSAPGCFQPALVANTDPTALGGTPIATADGVVLGGNSRTMVLQRIYHAAGPAAAAYRKHLAAHLHEFGLPPRALEGLKAPVVARVVEAPGADKAHLRELVRRYNEQLTQDLERTAEQVATSARLTDAVLGELQRVEDETLAAFLASPASKGLVRLLVQSEFIPKSRQNRLIGKSGLLSEEGRTYLQRALLGRILPDPELLDLLTDSLKDSLARATPFVLNAATVHNDPNERRRWDLAATLPAAVRIWSRARAAGLKDAAELAHQRELTSEGLDPLTSANVLLANLLLLRSGSRQLPDALRAFAEASTSTTTPLLFGTHPMPVPALATAAKLPVPKDKAIAEVMDFATGAPMVAPTPAPKSAPKLTIPAPSPKPAPTNEPAARVRIVAGRAQVPDLPRPSAEQVVKLADAHRGRFVDFLDQEGRAVLVAQALTSGSGTSYDLKSANRETTVWRTANRSYWTPEGKLRQKASTFLGAMAEALEHVRAITPP